ncbi:MAG: zinc ribbon domain-containing protein [Deltaproteobacteria bacterium]|nr:zinc ribbon domain-containing protein [Deltaproteobacteria bacterium]
MPIYEYQCRKCGKSFEIVQRISEPDRKSCKFCKGPVKRLMSMTTFHLKGSGWYVTDYGGKKPPAVEKEKSEAPKETSPSPTPAAETDSKKES